MNHQRASYKHWRWVWGLIVLGAVAVPPATYLVAGFQWSVISSLSLVVWLLMGTLEEVAKR